jgi:uncharacterized metal-binding protein YceD (DUF177 family)
MSAESTSPELEFSFPIDVTTLPPSGRSYTIEASAEERARVAERLDLQKIDALSAVLEVAPGRKGHIKVTGQVSADVTQTCVVSLAPVPAHVTDAVSASFITEERAAIDKLKKERAEAKGRKKTETDEEEVLAAHGEDPPEVATEGRIDLGEIAVVHLALALDPYPRAAGAAFDAKAWGGEPENDGKSATVSPFAALAKLKKPKS